MTITTTASPMIAFQSTNQLIETKPPRVQGCKAGSLQQGCTCSLVLNTTQEQT